MESALEFLPFVAWILAGATFAMTLLLGVILAYHWFRYAMNITATSIAIIAYGGVTLFLITGMFGSLVNIFGSL